MSIYERTDAHIRRFFSGHRVTEKQWQLGPAMVALPDLRVLEIAPGPRIDKFTWVTVGAAEKGLTPIEFLVVGDDARRAYVELLTMAAFYSLEHRLDLGHIVPIGHPLAEGSPCEHVYLALPYLFGPDLELIELDGKVHRVLWLFPITEGERKILRLDGVDALEDRLESECVEYGSLFRSSVA